MDIRTLAGQAAEGDRDAFCSLYGLYKDRLYRYAFYRLRDNSSAEDAVSECVLSAWKNIGGLRSADAFSTWIFRILSACCARQIRQKMEEREGLRLLGAERQNHREDNMKPDFSASVELSEALDQLSEEDRDIVLLSVIGGWKSAEIGVEFGMPPGSVRSRLSRSLARMRAFLESES